VPELSLQDVGLAAAINAGAQNNLGSMYLTGQGVPQDDAEAVKWYRLAAEQGDAAGQVGLGVMYANGRVAVRKWPSC